MLRSILCVLAICSSSYAAIIPSIPRVPSRSFLTDGLFEGGKNISANIADLRFSKHPKEGFERWVLDFADPKSQTVGTLAPHFQVRYVKADTVKNGQGKELILDSARFILSFRSIQKNLLTRTKVQELTKKSDLVREIIIHPMLEDGDMALEFILKSQVLFQPHQPLQNEGRLVLDIKRAQ